MQIMAVLHWLHACTHIWFKQDEPNLKGNWAIVWVKTLCRNSVFNIQHVTEAEQVRTTVLCKEKSEGEILVGGVKITFWHTPFLSMVFGWFLNCTLVFAEVLGIWAWLHIVFPSILMSLMQNYVFAVSELPHAMTT